MRKYMIKISLCLWILLLCGCGEPAAAYFKETAELETELVEKTQDAKDTKDNRIDEDDDTESADIFYVYICGAVANPGVYQVPSGSRVYEVIGQAGGLLEEAGADCINQAEYVTDGQMIKILTREEMAQDLSNEADADTSMGIGESKAGSIISYREEHGKFSSIEELMNITGIKEGVYTKIKEHITVN
ncbi:MAG: hypothetical protein BHW44_11505 [Roseburia sp. 40_7]|nr:MAG: hypothetical protein BHW44_11505 [Roseburia sp. 40_7]